MYMDINRYKYIGRLKEDKVNLICHHLHLYLCIRNPNRIKKIPQNVYGFVYRQSQLGSRVTTLQKDNLSTVDMYSGRKQPVRMIRQSQHGDNLRPLHLASYNRPLVYRIVSGENDNQSLFSEYYGSLQLIYFNTAWRQQQY